MFEPARQQIFFPPFVSNAGMFLFLGWIELDPGCTCKPRRPAALHYYMWLPATQTGLVSQQRGSWFGSMTNRSDRRDEELIGAPFYDDMKCCSVTRAVFSS